MTKHFSIHTAEEIAMDEPTTTTPELDTPTAADEQVVEDVLVEEVSIDGMCGVY